MKDSTTFFWLFVNGKKYIVMSDEELGDENSKRWDLEEAGFELVWDSAVSRRDAVRYAEQELGVEKVQIETVPITLKQACYFINHNHRHHVGPQGHKFSIGLSDGDKLVGVVVAGRPVGRLADDGFTLEVTRCCVTGVYHNSCSKLYAAVRRIAKELGYKRVITYTLEEECGTSLKASGFTFAGMSRGGSWNGSRNRIDKHPIGPKKVWECKIS